MRFRELHKAWFHLVVGHKGKVTTWINKAQPFNFMHALLVDLLKILLEFQSMLRFVFQQCFEFLIAKFGQRAVFNGDDFRVA